MWNPTEIHDSNRETIAAKIFFKDQFLDMFWLVVEPPLWKMMEFVNGFRMISMKWKMTFMFETTNQLFILIILFFAWKWSFPLYPSYVFHCFFFPVFPGFSSLWHFHVSFLCLENGPWPLGIATRNFFSNPFNFFSFCFVSVSFWLYFLPFLTLSLGIAKRSFSSNPFRLFFPCLYRCGYLSFLCLENCQKEFFLEPFSFFRFFFCVLDIFPSFAFKIDLGNCQNELYLEPFFVFFFASCFSLFFISIFFVFSFCIFNLYLFLV